MIGYVVMAGVLAAGIWLTRNSTRNRWPWLRWAFAGLLVACAMAASLAWPVESAAWAMLG
ncbi:MAG: hypothetical protein RL261_1115, partial [Pseudomonadota bacterium]